MGPAFALSKSALRVFQLVANGSHAIGETTAAHPAAPPHQDPSLEQQPKCCKLSSASSLGRTENIGAADASSVSACNEPFNSATNPLNGVDINGGSGSIYVLIS